MVRFDENNPARFAMHNGIVGAAILGYSLFVSPAVSMHSPAMSVEGWLTWMVAAGLTLLNYLNGMLLIATTWGLLRQKSWGVHLTHLWAIFTLLLALLGAAANYLFVAAPEAEMLRDVVRHDPFDVRTVNIHVRMMFIVRNWTAFFVVFDAMGTLGYLYAKRLSRLSDVAELVHRSRAAVISGAKQVREHISPRN